MTDTSVHAAWNAVMQAVQKVGKGDFNEQQNFRFRGIDAVVNAVGPALRDAGVVVVPDGIISIDTTEYTTGRNNTRMVNRLVTQWRVYGPAGDSFLGQSVGEAADAGDKSITKAQSVAYRTFLLSALCIPTGDRDPGADSHERTSEAVGSAEVKQTAKANKARDVMLAKLVPYGWTEERLTRRMWEDSHKNLRNTTDVKLIEAFTALLVEEAVAQELDDRVQQELAAGESEPLL